MLDTIIKNGRIVRLLSSYSTCCQVGHITDHTAQVTATEVLPLGVELGIKNGKIACLGSDLDAGPDTTVVDAEGAYITPGYAVFDPVSFLLFSSCVFLRSTYPRTGVSYRG